MRMPWLIALFLILVPVVLVLLKLFNDYEPIDSLSLALGMPILMVLLSSVALYVLLRLTNWHPRNRHRH